MSQCCYRLSSCVLRGSARSILLLLALGCFSVSGWANARDVNLAEMTSHAGRIIHGRVVDVRASVHPQQPRMAVTLIKLQVIEMLKGGAAHEVTFMQYGTSTQQYVAHLPKYSVGEEVVLFLYPESKLGLTSPVGQGQGKFVVRNDSRSGQRVLQNEQLNAALFARLDAAKVNSKMALSKAEREAVAQPERQAGAGLAVPTFCSLVRKFVATPNTNLQ